MKMAMGILCFCAVCFAGMDSFKITVKQGGEVKEYVTARIFTGTGVPIADFLAEPFMALAGIFYNFPSIESSIPACNYGIGFRMWLRKGAGYGERRLIPSCKAELISKLGHGKQWIKFTDDNKNEIVISGMDFKIERVITEY